MQRPSNPLVDRLWQASVAGCSCVTKTPEIKFHDELCHYRLHMECVQALQERAANVRATKFEGCSVSPPSVADDLVFCPDLYEMLLNVQNGIDSPASAGTANRIIRRIDKLRSALTKTACTHPSHGLGMPKDLCPRCTTLKAPTETRG